jgi:hypothetical protein
MPLYAAPQPAPSESKDAAEIHRLEDENEMLRSVAAQWVSNHRDVVDRLRLATQRPDLPVDRLPAMLRMEELQQTLNMMLSQDPVAIVSDVGIIKNVTNCPFPPGFRLYAAATCVCGEPQDKDIMHRTNAPCYYTDPQPAPSEAKSTNSPQNQYKLVEKDAVRACFTCTNAGRVDGLSQETHCDHCIYQESWRTDHYKAMEAKHD